MEQKHSQKLCMHPSTAEARSLGREGVTMECLFSRKIFFRMLDLFIAFSQSVSQSVSQAMHALLMNAKKEVEKEKRRQLGRYE